METENTSQEQTHQALPEQQHRWLQKLVGDWTFESMTVMPSGEPGEAGRGTETVQMLGDLWVLGRGEGEMCAGTTAHNLITLGYDPQKERFVGTWVGSMMHCLWVYEGELDADEKVLTLHTEGPAMTEVGKTGRYKDVITLHNDDHRTLTSYALSDNGEWHQFMTAHYRRTK